MTKTNSISGIKRTRNDDAMKKYEGRNSAVEFNGNKEREFWLIDRGFFRNAGADAIEKILHRVLRSWMFSL